MKKCRSNGIKKMPMKPKAKKAGKKKSTRKQGY